MARVLVVSLVFPPDGVSTAVIMGELSADLRRAGHEVTVITTVPHYNRDERAEARQPLARRWGGLLFRSDYHGIPVLHVAMPRKTASVARRLLAWTQFHVLSVLAALAHVRRADVILAPSPPLTVGLVAWALGLRYRAPFVYNVQELYPDIAITLGALRHRGLIKVLYGLERFVYRRARFITVIAERMRERVIHKGIPPLKVRLIPNFADVDDLVPIPRDNEFSRTHGLMNRFVVTYAGNMGPAQDLDGVLDAARLLLGDPRVCVLLVGEGSAYARLDARVRAERLTNVLMLPHQPYGLVPQIYASSDVCLVPLAKDAGSDAVPSKVYRIMACERPVLVCADSQSDLAELVRTAGSGVVVPQGDPQALAAAIDHMLSDPAATAAMGRAGRARVLADFSREAVSRQYVTLLTEAIRPAGAGNPS
jgi:colanic acid biosynthesis glycosyl transferase WcaI